MQHNLKLLTSHLLHFHLMAELFLYIGRKSPAAQFFL